MKISTYASAIGMIAALTGCAQTVDEHPTSEDSPVMVDLRVRENSDADYMSVASFTVPDSHEIGDGMMPYEGVGWENAYVGYRLYLDGRLVSDIFGKQVSEPALGKISEFGSYHDLAPWGMDVLKVGPSLGIGGLGIIRDGEPTQFGSVPVLIASIEESGGENGAFTITAGGIETSPSVTAGFSAQYSMAATSPLTLVNVTADEGLPLTTGLVMHDGAELLQSTEATGDWRYIATWGDEQSENNDGLGMALFYRADQGRYGGMANSTQYVVFGQPEFTYGFLAAWERDPSGVSSRDDFTDLLEDELGALEGATE